MRDPTAELLQAMASVGLHPKQIHWDNRFRRFPGINRKKGDAGWLKAFVDQRGAIFGDNRTKQQWNWPSDDPEWRKSMKGLEPLSAEEVRTKQAKAVAERVKDAKKATELVRKLWESAKKPPTNHPYLEKKGIAGVPVLRSTVDSKTNEPMLLLIPMRNVDGELICLQRIWPDGTRRQMWQPGGCRGLYDTIGAKHYRETKTLHVCEGWTTGWSIHLATKSAVIVAFFDGGLKTVGKIIKKKYPEARIVICADNDRWSPVKRDGKDVNPGVYAARAAAKELGADLAIPEFENLDNEPTDFDDLRQREGIDAVRKWLDPKMADKAVTEAWKPKADAKAEAKAEAKAAPRDVPADFYDTTPAALGRRILKHYQDRILIVNPGKSSESGWPVGSRGKWGEPCAYWLRPSGGWDPTPMPWRSRIVSLLDSMEKHAREHIRGARRLGKTVGAIQMAMRRRDIVESVRLNLGAVAALDLDAYPELTTCTVDHLDRDLRYMGCDNGVLDLQKGRLLSPEAGRLHLVTKTTGLAYDPAARHEDVDRMFAHLGDREATWFMQTMGHSLHGMPSRRIYLIVGPPNGGKTQAGKALVNALGEYATYPMDTALAKAAGSGQHNVEVGAFSHPTRVCVFDDFSVPRGGVSSTMLKRASGDGAVTYRPLHGKPRTVDGTATMFIICNPASIPSFTLEDEAMRDRIRELPYPKVPVRDPDFKRRVGHARFRQAFFAKLVRAACAMTPGVPPDTIPTVKAATNARIEEDIGEIGVFAKRLLPSADRHIHVSEVWDAWCKYNSSATEAPESGGIKRSAFAKRLKKLIPTLGKVGSVRSHTLNGKTGRGWKNFSLVALEDTPGGEM